MLVFAVLGLYHRDFARMITPLDGCAYSIASLAMYLTGYLVFSILFRSAAIAVISRHVRTMNSQGYRP
jgi:hypothetical protein